MVASFKRSPSAGNLEARIADLTARRMRNRGNGAAEPVAAADGAAVNGAPVAPPAAGKSVEAAESEALAALRDQIVAQLGLEIPPEIRRSFARREWAQIVEAAVQTQLARQGIEIDALQQRNLITAIMQRLRHQEPPPAAPREEAPVVAPRREP